MDNIWLRRKYGIKINVNMAFDYSACNCKWSITGGASYTSGNIWLIVVIFTGVVPFLVAKIKKYI